MTFTFYLRNHSVMSAFLGYDLHPIPTGNATLTATASAASFRRSRHPLVEVSCRVFTEDFAY